MRSLNKMQRAVEVAALFYYWHSHPGTNKLEQRLRDLAESWTGERDWFKPSEQQESNVAQNVVLAAKSILAETDNVGKRASSREGLKTIFSEVRLTNPHSKSEALGYQPGVLDPERVFPRAFKKVSQVSAATVESQLLEELSQLLDCKGLAYESFLLNYLAILEKYAWSYPAQGADVCVPLVEQIKALLAVSSALYAFHADAGDFSLDAINDVGREKFLLLTGDVSGIQRYIFEVSNVGVGGVAKRLRARSFFISALSMGLAHKVVHDIGVTVANILVQAGGNFYILLPNTKQVREYVAKLRQTVNRQLFTEYGGDLFFNLAALPFRPAELANYPQVLRRASELLAEEKMRPLSTFLQSDSGWVVERFVGKSPYGVAQGYCASCGKLPGEFQVETEEIKSICRLCQRDLDVGRWLPQAQCIAFYDHKPCDRETMELPGGIWAVLSPDAPKEAHPIVVLLLNSVHLKPFFGLPAVTQSLGSYVPMQGGEVLDFSDIAAKAQRKQVLGVLKADVDNLGALFALGLGNKSTLMRTATMSHQLGYFFGTWLTQVLKSTFTNTYLVYSGGDDLLAVGPWNEVIDLAKFIKDEFSRFVGHNPDITLSAGIALMKPKQPISHGVQQAEEMLEASKSSCAIGYGKAKNQLTALKQTIKWSDLEEVLSNCSQLAEWLEQGLVKTVFVHRLLRYFELYKLWATTRNAYGLKFAPLLMYDSARNLKTTEQKPVKLWASRLIKDQGVPLRNLGFISRYVLLQRGERRNGE